MGRRGPEPLHDRRDEFARLIAEGVPSARAPRMVGISPRTGRRWRNGRRLATTRSVLEEETRMLAFARNGRGTCRPLGEPDRVGGPHSQISRSSRQKCRWRERVHEVDGLCPREVFLRSKDLPQLSAAQRQEIVGAGEADHCAQLDARVEIDAGKPFPIERQHRGNIGARRMAHDDEPAPIAANLGDAIDRPAHYSRRILDESREAHLRVNSVIGNDGREAAGCQRRPNKKIIASFTAFPAAAVEEHDDGGGSACCRRIDIKDMARTTAITHTLTGVRRIDPGDRIQTIDRRREQVHASAVSRGARLIAAARVIDQKPTNGRKRRPSNP